MKAEFLKNFGLEQDAIDKIMAENAKTFQPNRKRQKMRSRKQTVIRNNWKLQRHHLRSSKM